VNAMLQRYSTIVAAVTLLTSIEGCSPDETATSEQKSQQTAADFERGPHRGRMLRDGAFALEITIFEEGVPPEFRVYAYQDDQPLPSDQVQLSVELRRLGGKSDRFAFKPRLDYLQGNGIVREPHSFDVKVAATRGGKTSSWSYASYEGRVRIAAEAAQAAGLAVETAGPAVIREQLSLTGAIQANPARLARVRARFPGVVRDVRKGLGDLVSPGERLATVQSNESLQNYPITAPISGAVLMRNAVAGEATSEEPLFVIGDLSKIWAELDVFGRELGRVKQGQPVRVVSLDEDVEAQGVIVVLAPLTTHSSQSVRARVVLDNDQGIWRPGQFVRGIVTIAETKVPLAVKNSALQRFRDFTVVFAQAGDTYEVRMLELGRSDGVLTEVLGGLDPGERYVTENSFLVKADIEKSGASHDH